MSELLFYWFPGNIQCSNPFCKNGLSLKNKHSVSNVITTKRVIHNLTGSNTTNTKEYSNNSEKNPYNSFSSFKNIEKGVHPIQSIAKESSSRK